MVGRVTNKKERNGFAGFMIMIDTQITVIMPVYNGERYLRAAIDSVLKQTFRDFKLLIINDGSTDKTEEIIKSYSDERIDYVVNEQNLGLVKTLNRGLKMVQTKYIARLDSDDLCEPNRFEQQYLFMEAHPDIALVGSRAKLIDGEGMIIGSLGQSCDARKARTLLLFSNIFVHSSIMLRTGSIRQENLEYDTRHIAVEDYGLWCKITEKFPVANLSDTLVQYRMNPEGIMANVNDDWEKHTHQLRKIHVENFMRMGLAISTVEMDEFCRFLYPLNQRCDVTIAAQVLNGLLSFIERNDAYDTGLFKSITSGICRGYFMHWEVSVNEFFKIIGEHFRYFNPYLETLKYLGSLLKQQKFIK